MIESVHVLAVPRQDVRWLNCKLAPHLGLSHLDRISGARSFARGLFPSPLLSYTLLPKNI